MSDFSDSFLQIKTNQQLADFLGIKIGTLLFYCQYSTPSNAYITFNISKKNGCLRLISAPNKQLKHIQTVLSKVLNEFYVPKKTAHGFIKQRSIITNAEIHTNKRCMLNIDIKDFFGSIHIGRVIGLFKSMPFLFNKTIATSLAQLVCYKNHLPQGAPTSPVISNLICRKLDNDLIMLASKHKVLCTRYCDDITFSTKARILPPQIAKKLDDGKVILGDELRLVFSNNKFVINEEKTRCQFFFNRQMVTGLIVNEKVNIPRKKYKHIRAIMHYTYNYGEDAGATKNNFIKKDGTPDTERFMNCLKGNIEYLKMVLSVDDLRYRRIATQFNELNGEVVFPIPDSFETKIKNYIFIIEQIGKEPKSQGTAFLVKGLGLVTCLHNICSIAKPLSDDKLAEIVENNVKVFHPDYPDTFEIVSFKYSDFNQDLLILNTYKHKECGFELASQYHSYYSLTKERCTAVGYPDYSETSTATVLRDVKITTKRKSCEQWLYDVNARLSYGASGGPVFNANNEVIGYIDRGNKMGENEENNNSICLIDTRIFERLEKKSIVVFCNSPLI